MTRWLTLKKDELDHKAAWLLALIAYIFAVAFRIHKANYTSLEALKTEGQFINTPDGFYFAKGALDLLNNVENPIPGSTVSSLLSQTTAFLTRILPFEFETVVFFMPAFFGSLVVFPIVWIGYSIRQTYLGFLAALMGGVAYSYFVRTQTGYYDTDMLTVVSPMLVVACVISAATSRKEWLLPLITLVVVIGQTWYPQSYAIHAALFAAVIGYAVLFFRKDVLLYQTAFFILLGIVPTALKANTLLNLNVAIALIVFACIIKFGKKFNKYFFILFAALVAYYFYSGGVVGIFNLLNMYVFRSNETLLPTNSISINFFSVISTVKEAGKIDVEQFSRRISGDPKVFLISCLGYIFLLCNFRPLLLTLPLTGLGFLALKGGLRFTIYAVPTMSLGLAFFIVFLSQKLNTRRLFYPVSLAAMGIVLLINYQALNPLNYPAAFSKREVDSFGKLAKIVKSNDVIVSWWDYGHPLRYYLNAYLPIDGGAHTGEMNFPVSYALMSTSAKASAQILRASMEERVLITKKPGTKISGYLRSYLKKNKTTNPNDYIKALEGNHTPTTTKTSEIYLVLFYRMLPLLSTIDLFGNIDLQTGEKRVSNFYYPAKKWLAEKNVIRFPNGIVADINQHTVFLGKQKIPLRSLAISKYVGNKLKVERQIKDPNGKLNLILMQDFNRLILTDNRLADSTYIKLFVLEEYDPKYFEPVLLDPLVKVYRLKI